MAPPDAYQGEVQRIMYLHLPSILTAYLSYFLVFIGSGMYLWKREKKDDLLAHAAAELGVLFTALTIIEGSIWGKPTWGVWWTWDARLTLTAILLLIYAGYLMLRSSIDDRAARRLRGGDLGDYRLSRHPADSHVGVLVAHTAPAAVDPAPRQSALGERPPGHVDRPGDQLRRLSVAVLLLIVAALSRRRDAPRDQGLAPGARGLMGPWGYVSLAYGIVWGIIVVYWFLLKRRYRAAETELNRLRSSEAAANHDKN